MAAFFGWFFLYVTVPSVVLICTYPTWVAADAVCICLYTVCLLLWLWRKDTYRVLLTVRKNGLLAALPLLVFAVANVVSLRGLTFSVTVVSLIAGAVVEELLFRCVLFTGLEKINRHAAVWGTAVLFSLYHLIAADYMQALCALCFGLVTAAYVCRFRAVLPCVAAHVVTNALSGSDPPLWVLLICCAVCAVYGCWLYLRKGSRIDNGL